MPTADVGLEALRDVVSEFAAFKAGRGKVSESDTRAKVIDRVLKECLMWPEDALSREDYVHSGYIDYTLRIQSRPYVAVEAKREGASFELPEPTRTHRSLKLDGALTTDAEIRAAIEQVRAYCDDCGMRYAIATNGYCWIVFRAIREDMPWRKGLAKVFASFEHIENSFTEFWNLLSYAAITGGALDAEFGAPNRRPRSLVRVVDTLYNADLPLQRNRLHAQLHPLITKIFENIADQDEVEILQACYVHSASLKIIAEDLDVIITDAMPSFIQNDGAKPLHQGPDDAGRFGIVLADAMPSKRGQLFLLLGGIGSGKTTFLKRYQRTVGADLLNARALWFHVDFLSAPNDLTQMEEFVWRSVLDQLRTRYTSPHLETRKNIKKAFRADIEALEQTGLRGLRAGSDTYESTLSPYLAKWQANVSEYVPKLLQIARSERKLEVVLFVDNVDQLSPAYQAQIFLLGQRVTRSVGSITVVSLREESYYTATIQRAFTAYTSRKFHIASPQFRRLIGSRIRFAIDALERQSSVAESIVPEGIDFDSEAVKTFLKIVHLSVFERKRNIALFIESLCFGNMRMALEMFTTFLVSGATDVDKMLAIYSREGAYYVAFHEFVKSIMLGDRKYYKESTSPVMNIYDCGAERNSSHFTSLRLLRFLLAHRGESAREGQGYYEIARIVTLFEDLFDNREDTIKSFERLLARQLVEVNTRSTETIAGASHVRVTSAGWYYSRYLSGLFAYLDLVLQDTPLNDQEVQSRLRASVAQVDNLSDRETEKTERMRVRFDRVEEFLHYLETEESAERAGRDLLTQAGVLGEPIVAGLRESLAQERSWIERRLRENRERVRDDVPLATLSDVGIELIAQARLFEADELPGESENDRAQDA